MRYAMLRGLLALALPTAAIAAPATAPAAVPDYSKHFYFHKVGVSTEVATADYRECATYGENIINVGPGVQNTYVPYYAAPGLSPLAAGLAGGLGGMIGNMLVEAMVKAPERRDMRRTIMRKCMYFKGYTRYGIDEARFDELTKGDDKDAEAARFGALAAGPQPTAKALTA